eukprot:9469075-Pyramimonas_sp.AAC.1
MQAQKSVQALSGEGHFDASPEALRGEGYSRQALKSDIFVDAKTGGPLQAHAQHVLNRFK